jgi:hypothetical protein
MGDNNEYGDSDFLADRDKTVHDFRASDKETKHKIIEKMLTLRHNMKYNKHLLSVYMRAKGIFDTMVDEHRSQVEHLDEIYRHLNNLIRENLSAQRNKPVDASSKLMMAELVKDKKRMGGLLKKMRSSFDKLMDIDTVVGVTIDQINKLTFMEDHADDEPEDEGEDEDEDESDDESESEPEDEDESESEPEDESESESESDPESDDESESEPEDEDESESEPEDELEGEDEDESEGDESEEAEDEEAEDEEAEDDDEHEDEEAEDDDEDEGDEPEGEDSEPEGGEGGEGDDAKKPVIYLF